MKRINLKSMFRLFLIILVLGFVYISFAMAEDPAEQVKFTPIAQESKEATRIIISTSGPAEFTAHWLENPPRLVIKFQTKNVITKIGSELIVDQGVIKKITSDYFGRGENKPLKSLTFELREKAPYKIWQEDNSIILDIQFPLDVPMLFDEGKEIFNKYETKDEIIKRLDAMDTALTELTDSQAPAVTPKAEVKETKKNVIILSENKPIQFKEKKFKPPIFLSIGLILISGLGLAWLFWRRYRLILDKNIAAREVAKLKAQLQEQNKVFEHEQIIRKTVEETSLKKEKEFEQLNLDLQKKKKLLEQEGKARKTIEEELSQKEKEYLETKGSLESLKEVLVEKGFAKKLTTPEKEGELWIAGKSEEKREFPRLDLSRDYNRTIILRIESPDKTKSIKSFANNIGMGGLCFETRHEFKEKQRINVRLFFFGDKVPMMRIQAKVIWSKIDTPVNRYGISFVSSEEKDKTELSRYIESNIPRG